MIFRQPCRSVSVRSFWLAAAFIVCTGFAFLLPARAQDAADDIPVVTRTTAIRNARIVQSPEEVIERGTVVMHDGLITAVGENVDVPYDAAIIDGDSLTVYAGFIDGLSHAGIPKQENEQDREGRVNPADPPDDLAGIRPDRHARTLVDPDDDSIENLRELGFTVAHTVPRGRMLPGTGAIIMLAGDEAREMVLRPDVSLFFQFEGAPGVYPATPIGVMSTLRQLVREAERRQRIETLYAENPAGLERPSYDPVHEAFYPVLSRERPVYVLADGEDSAMEVHRAMQLQDELDFSLALAGLSQGFDVVDDLDGTDTPLFLTLNLPEEPGEGDADTTATDTTKAVTPEDPATFFVSDLRTHSYEDVEAEQDNLEARQALERARYYGTAADFHEAGLRFGVTTMSAETKDIRKNLRRMIDAGLSEDAALAALTIDGARLLGIERSAGTVEEGKLANLVVTKGSYFDPESPIRYVFVDGQKYEVEDESDAAPDDLAAFEGDWTISVQTPDGPVEATLSLEASGGELTGTVSGGVLTSPAAVEDVRVDGERLRFTFDTSQYGSISADLDVEGSSLSGTLDVPGVGSLDVSGTKPDRS